MWPKSCVQRQAGLPTCSFQRSGYLQRTGGRVLPQVLGQCQHGKGHVQADLPRVDVLRAAGGRVNGEGVG